MKLKFNSKMVPICVHYFLLIISTGFGGPYLTLLLRSIGLTLKDASLVMGLSPVITGVLTPITGYIGDKVGFKILLILTILGCIASSTALNFIPIYREYDAKIALDNSIYNSSLETVDLKSIIWFGKYEESSAGCEYTALENVIKEIACDDAVFNTDINFSVDDIKKTVSDNCTDLNVQTCKYFVQEENVNDFTFCNVKFTDESGKYVKGSHTLTFWIYFILKTSFSLFVNVYYNISDGAATTIAVREGSTYTLVMFVGTVGGLFPNFISGPLVDHFSFGTNYVECLTQETVVVNDFKLPFLIQDALMVGSIIVIFFFLDIIVEKPEKKVSVKREFGWLLNPAPIGFFLIMAIGGATVGASNTYLYIFAQEELGASASFLGYMSFANTILGLLMIPTADYVIKHLGIINTFCLSFIIFMLRLVGYGLTYTVPPYPFFAYTFMEACSYYWMVAIMSYNSVMAPQSLIATAISIGSVMIWIVGQGAGSFLAGILVEMYSIRVMFIIFGIGGSSIFLGYWILYHLVIKRYEVNQNKQIEDNQSGKSDQDDSMKKNLETFNSGKFISTRM